MYIMFSPVSVADPDLGSGAFYTSRFWAGIRDNFLGTKFCNFVKFMAKVRQQIFLFPFSFLLLLDPGSEIWDPGWKKIRIQDKHPGSAKLFLNHWSSKIDIRSNKTTMHCTASVIRGPVCLSYKWLGFSDLDLQFFLCQKSRLVISEDCVFFRNFVARFSCSVTETKEDPDSGISKFNTR
jgi:hypothetical protein